MCQLRNHRKLAGISQLQVLFSLRVLFPSSEDYELEKAFLNLSMVMEQELNTTKQTLGILSSEVSSLGPG